jgi:hypothetical protein
MWLSGAWVILERAQNEELHCSNNSDNPMLGSVGIHRRFTWLGSLTMTTNKIMALARKHLGAVGGMESSARLCLSDANHLFDRGLIDYAKKRALDSLRFSVGIFHQDYIKATK